MAKKTSHVKKTRQRSPSLKTQIESVLWGFEWVMTYLQRRERETDERLIHDAIRNNTYVAAIALQGAFDAGELTITQLSDGRVSIGHRDVEDIPIVATLEQAKKRTERQKHQTEAELYNEKMRLKVREHGKDVH